MFKLYRIVLTLVVIFPFYGNTQPAIKYFELVRKAEKFVIHNNIDSALISYDLAFETFNYPFIKELYQATIISSYSNNLNRFYFYLEKALNKGMGINELELFDKRFENDSNFIEIKRNFNSYRDNYIKSIDTIHYNCFKNIDIHDQIKTQESGKIGKYDDYVSRGFIENKARYLKMIDSLGWPDECKVGIGNVPLIGYFNNKEDPYGKYGDKILKQIESNILTGNNRYSVFVLSNKKYPTNLLYENARCGNGFLWHYTCYLDTVFNNFLFSQGVLGLHIHPLFLAQGIERSGEIDFLLGVGSDYFLKKLKYKAAKKYLISTEDKNSFNELRAKFFIRTINEEELLIKALLLLENKKKIEKIRSYHIKKYSKLIFSFVNKNVA
jgi:hypothetical protein